MPISPDVLYQTGDFVVTSDDEVTDVFWNPPVPVPSYKGEVAWGQTTGGLFTFGTSQFGSAVDLLAASSWSSGFGGTYDDLTATLRDVEIARGRDTAMDDVRAGTLTANGRDASGIYNPYNPSSPLAALLDTDKPFRFAATYAGVTYPLYYGFVSDIEADPSGRGTYTITAVDFLDKLDRQSPALATISSGWTDGQVIGAILDWFRWTDPAMRNLGVGDTVTSLPYTFADGKTSGLRLVSDLLQAERGLVIVDKGGAVKYIDRISRLLSLSAGAIDKTLTAFLVGRTNQNIINQWTVQRVDAAGTDIGVPQTWPDPAGGLSASQRLHGVVSQTLTTAFLNTDTQALNLAQYLITRTADTQRLVFEVPLTIPDQATMVQVLSRDLGDRVTLTIQPRNMPLIQGDFYIESITHAITAKGQPRHACTWRVSQVPSSLPFRFGLGHFGGPEGLPY